MYSGYHTGRSSSNEYEIVLIIKSTMTKFSSIITSTAGSKQV